MGTALPLDSLASGLSGFGHPLRIRALALMLEGETSPRDLAVALGENLGVTSYHIRMLAGYGLVRCTRTEPRRGALAHFYECTPLAHELFGHLADLMALPNMGNSGKAKRFERLVTWANNGNETAAVAA